MVTTYTVRVADVSGVSRTQTFTLQVNGPLTATVVIPVLATTTGQMTSSTGTANPVTVTGGVAPYVYHISPALPANSAMTTAGGIVGTNGTSVGAVFAAQTFTLSIDDSGSPQQSTSASFSYVINPALVLTVVVPTTVISDAQVNFTPVTTSGGTSPSLFVLTDVYNAATTLPQGLSFNTTTGAITGAVTQAFAQIPYRVNQVDGSYGTNRTVYSTNFTIRATGGTLSPALALSKKIGNKHLPDGSTQSFQPYLATGGTTPYAYAITPALAYGLSMDTTTGIISGTVSGAVATATYTITVTDGINNKATGTFTVDAGGPLVFSTFNSAVVGAVNLFWGAAGSITVVTATGGTGTLTFTSSPAFAPNTYAVNADGRAFAPTPVATLATTTYTMTVTDSDTPPVSVSRTYTLTINPQMVMTVAVPSSIIANGASVNFTPVTTTGGANPGLFSISPALPAGLLFSTATGAVTGTMPAGYIAKTYTVSRRDAGTNGGNVTLTATFYLQLKFYTTSLVATQTTSGAASVNFIPVSSAGGVGAVTWTISPALQPSLSFSATSGAVTGQPTTPQPAITYTVTGTDSDSPASTSSKTFDLTVNPPLIVSANATYSSVKANVADVVSFSPANASQGTQPYTYSVSPALPGGLSIGPSTGIVSGTSTAVKALTTYTVTVIEKAGTSGTSTFDLQVYAQLLAATAIPAVSLKVNTASAGTTPVTAAGGQGTLSYTISPTLPTGLILSPTTAKITGTPTATQGPITYTVTATDSSTSPTHSAIATFSLSIIN